MINFVELAKQAIEAYVKNNIVIKPPSPLPPEYRFKKGVFISLESGGDLRGCIGTYSPIKSNLAEEIIANSIAATKDPRFKLLQIEELSELKYSVYILEPPELIKDINQLDPKIYGLIIKGISTKLGNVSALLLPDLPGIYDSQSQLKIVCQKAGLELNEPPNQIFRFKAKKYHL